MSFDYATERGTRLTDRVQDASDTALWWVLAALGPPLLTIIFAVLLWRRWVQRWWTEWMARIDHRISLP